MSMSAAAGNKTWYPLMRRDGKDAVGGQLRLGFAWDVTARSLMSLMLKALEHVLQQRREILCMLAPVSPHTAMTWSIPGSSAASTATLQVCFIPLLLADCVHVLHAMYNSCMKCTCAELCSFQHGVVLFLAAQLPLPTLEVCCVHRTNSHHLVHSGQPCNFHQPPARSFHFVVQSCLYELCSLIALALCECKWCLCIACSVLSM